MKSFCLSAIDLNGSHYLFRDVNSFPSARFKENFELSIENKKM